MYINDSRNQERRIRRNIAYIVLVVIAALSLLVVTTYGVIMAVFWMLRNWS
jgi:hypothetical protein